LVLSPGRGEATVYECRADPGDLDDLVAAGPARNEADVGARHVERVCKQGEHLVVGAATLRSRGDPDLPRVAMTPDDSGAPGPRGHSQPYARRLHGDRIAASS